MGRRARFQDREATEGSIGELWWISELCLRASEEVRTHTLPIASEGNATNRLVKLVPRKLRVEHIVMQDLGIYKTSHALSRLKRYLVLQNVYKM